MKNIIRFFLAFVSLMLSISCATARPMEIYTFDAIVTCEGGDCNEAEARRQAANLAEAAIPPHAAETRPALLTALLYGGTTTLGCAAAVGADVGVHQMTDHRIRPVEPILLCLGGAGISALITAIVD